MVTLQELKQQSFIKILLRGKSGRGKTYELCRITLKLLDKGFTGLYVDTESEGSTTLVDQHDELGLDEEILENLEYEQVDDYDEFMSCLEKQDNYDFIIIDTFDSKHTFVLKHVTDAKTKADADWNQYPKIYSEEKDLMEKVAKPDTNILGALDPDSGSMDKPKGCQTNIHGSFNIVVDLKKTSDGWGNSVRNWVGKSEITKANANVNNLEEALVKEISDRIQEDD